MFNLRSFLLTLMIFTLTACEKIPDSQYFKPSPEPFTFDYTSDIPFDTYLDQNKAYLAKNRVFFDPTNQARELAWVSPFDWPINNNCSKKPTKGVLLIHGFLNTAFSTKDVGKIFHDLCFHVRSITLPGHSTRPGDLLSVSKQDWIASVAYAIGSLQTQVEEVHLVGHSLGGLLAVHAGTQHANIKSMFLIAPALQTSRPFLTKQTTWLRYLKTWINTDPNVIPVKYQSIPTHAVAELVGLIDLTVKQLKANGGLKQPMFLMLSEDDKSIESIATLKILLQHAHHPKSKIDFYTTSKTKLQTKLQDAQLQDKRISYINSYIPKQKILNFSHVAFPFTPENEVFGINGIFKECGKYDKKIDRDQVAVCEKTRNPWQGALASSNDPNFLPIQRLTYNPLFHTMKQDFKSFIDHLSSSN